MKKLFTELKPNSCHKCGSDDLWLVEYECTMNRLNESGSIVESFNDSYSNKLICPHCGEEYHNVGKKGMSYYIKSELPPVRRIMKDFNPFQS